MIDLAFLPVRFNCLSSHLGCDGFGLMDWYLEFDSGRREGMKSIDNGKDGPVLAHNPDTKAWMEFLRPPGKMETTRSENAKKERLWANLPPKAAIG